MIVRELVLPNLMFSLFCSTQSASSVPAIIRRLADHKQKFLVLLYVILLCLIGLLSSKRFWMKVGHFYDEILAYTSSTDSHS